MYYVYVLFDAFGVPRYVGKGKGNRWLIHERYTDPNNWMKNEFIEQTWIILGEIPKIKIQDKDVLVSPMNRQDPERLPDYKVLSRNSQTQNSTANPNVK